MTEKLKTEAVAPKPLPEPAPVASLRSIRHRREVSHGHLVIVCRHPGLRRAGHVHPAVGVYSKSRFNDLQLGQLEADPLLEVIEVH